MGVSQPIPVIGGNIRVAIDMDRPIVYMIELPIPDIIGVLVPGSVVVGKARAQKFPVLQGIVGGLLACHLVLIFLLIVVLSGVGKGIMFVQPDTADKPRKTKEHHPQYQQDH
jgi:hypothetical protein